MFMDYNIQTTLIYVQLEFVILYELHINFVAQDSQLRNMSL